MDSDKVLFILYEPPLNPQSCVEAVLLEASYDEVPRILLRFLDLQPRVKLLRSPPQLFWILSDLAELYQTSLIFPSLECH